MFLQSKRKAPLVDAHLSVCDLVVSMPNPLDKFLGAFMKLWRATVSFVMAVCTEQPSSHWTDIHEILYLSIFLKICQENSSFIKTSRITGTLREHQYAFLIISHSVLPRMKYVSDESCRENGNIILIFNNIFSKIVLFMRYCGKRV